MNQETRKLNRIKRKLSALRLREAQDMREVYEGFYSLLMKLHEGREVWNLL